jgi:DNA-binding NarL/FixJ family response regulator
VIRVLLVDDQSLLRLGFRMILEAEPGLEVVGEAADGASGVDMVMATRPDVVLMDIRMPGMDGIAATAKIVEAGTGARVLILTTFDLDQYVVDGLRAGASGFLLKDVPGPDLVAAIRTVTAGESVLAPTATRRLIDRFMPLLPDPERYQHLIVIGRVIRRWNTASSEARRRFRSTESVPGAITLCRSPRRRAGRPREQHLWNVSTSW